MERSRRSSGAFPSLKFWGAFDAAAACSWRRRRPPPRPRGGRRVSRLTGLSRRREEAIEVALRAKLAARAERRAKSSAAARKEIAEFTAEFLSAAREVFELMDEDDSGTLVVDEIVKAVDPKKGNKARTRRPTTARTSTCEDSVICGGTAVFVCLVCGGAGTTERPRHTSRRSQKVIKFLKTCGEENLQFLLHPPRLQKALEILDTDKSGEVDADEWRVARRPPSGFVSFV